MSKETLKDMTEILNVLSGIKDIDLLYEAALLYLRAFTGATEGSFYLCNGRYLNLVYSQNDALSQNDPLGKTYIPIDSSSLIGYTAATGQILNIANVHHIPSKAPYQFDACADIKIDGQAISVLTLPLNLLHNNKVLGVIQLFNAKDKNENIIAFSEEYNAILPIFANVISIVMQRLQDLRWLLFRLTSLVQLRDPQETGAHINRVSNYATEIYEDYAIKNWIPRQKIDETKVILRFAAMLHDVGKVAVSDIVLCKPGPLTAGEFEAIKRHTVEGAKIFENQLTDFDEMVYRVILEHHENWDGMGYPYGKKKDEISLFAQMVSIADVFDALVTKRVYKDSWSVDQATEEIKSLSGTKFNPELVDCFVDTLPLILRARSMYPC